MSVPLRTVLEARHVSKTVTAPDGQPLPILQDIDLHLGHGQSLAIVGASGSGKTTLLGLLAGLDRPSSGQILLAGHPLHSLNEEDRAALRRQLVGFVFQSFHLLPALSAEENVMLPLELEGVRGARELARAALREVGLDRRLRHYPAHLSGGEQQRVAIARAFVHRPQLLFADEPTGNLDGGTGRAIIDLLFGLNREHHTTLVLVTHDLALAGHCDQHVEVADGRLLPQASQPRQVRA